MAQPEPTIYRTQADVDAYFAAQLFATDWTGATDADKAKAMLGAARAVDRMAYRGVKFTVFELLEANPDATTDEIAEADTAQIRQFPRNGADDPESWSLSIDATGGTFRVVFNAEQTAAIAYDEIASEIEVALQALPSVPAGEVLVTVAPGGVDSIGPYLITTAGALGSTRFNQISINESGLTGGGSTLLVDNDNIPDELFYAICEESMALLSGRLPGQEFRNLTLTSDGIGSTRIASDRSQMPPEHSAHFVTSPEAWAYIRQFVDDNNTFDTTRVN